MKGHTPANKGKTWDEFMSKKGQRNARKGWKNLDIHRNKNGRPDTAGRCRKKVVAIRDNGTFTVFDYIGSAAQAVGGSRENVGRCCRENASGKVLKHEWGRGRKKGSSLINTDHKYLGIRWYFEKDFNIWKTKIVM